MFRTCSNGYTPIPVGKQRSAKHQYLTLHNSKLGVLSSPTVTCAFSGENAKNAAANKRATAKKFLFLFIMFLIMIND